MRLHLPVLPGELLDGGPLLADRAWRSEIGMFAQNHTFVPKSGFIPMGVRPLKSGTAND